MALDTYLVRYKKDTNPHYPGKLEAMDIGSVRVLTSSPEAAKAWTLENRKEVVEIIEVKMDNTPKKRCQCCGSEV